MAVCQIVETRFERQTSKARHLVHQEGGMAVDRVDHGWRVPAYGLACLGMIVVYLLALVALAFWLTVGSHLTHSWQVVSLLVATGLLIPLKQASQRRLERRLQPSDAILREEGLGQWLQALAMMPRDPLAALPLALCDALRLHAAAVALPEGDGWRIAHCQGQSALLGSYLTDSFPGETTFLGRWQAPFTAIAGGVRLNLDDCPAVLVLLGAKRSGESLVETDLRVAELLLAGVAGMVGYAQSQIKQRRAEAELPRLYDYVAALQQAMRGQRFEDMAVHEVRSALTVILGHAELLLDGVYGAIDDRQRGHIAAIHRQADALAETIGTTAVTIGDRQGRS